MLLELKVARLSRLQAAKGNSIAKKMNYMTEKRGSGDKRDYERISGNTPNRGGKRRDSKAFT
jgi:hypothetical protein